MEGEAEAITRKAIEAAKGGDMAAIRLVLDRIAPPRRERAPTGFSIPEVETLADLPKAAAALVRACADGLLSPGEAEQLARVLAAQRDALMASDLEARISALEGRRPRVEVV